MRQRRALGCPNARCPVTHLGTWLWRLGVDIIHGRPYHPQTQGKLERFHRTLKAEVIKRPHWMSLGQCQRAFDQWRWIYNQKRPHESLDDQTPASRYRLSTRSLPEELAEWVYEPGVLTRCVCRGGAFSLKNISSTRAEPLRAIDWG